MGEQGGHALVLFGTLGIGHLVVVVVQYGGGSQQSFDRKGCYPWFNDAPVVIRTDGTMVGGPLTGHWRLVSAARHAYTFTWPESTDTVTISADQRSLKRRESVWLSCLGDAHHGKYRTCGDLALVKRL